MIRLTVDLCLFVMSICGYKTKKMRESASIVNIANRMWKLRSVYTLYGQNPLSREEMNIYKTNIH